MMGVQKVNHHKPTRFARNGFREALCPICDQWVYVTSYRNDTRWRWMRHRAAPGAKDECPGSLGLIPAEPKGGAA